MTLPLDGGCLCGAIRYRMSAAPLRAGYCHCLLCRKSTGAPALAWASVPLAGFAFTRGRPTEYRSSARGLRQFCGRCGAQILYREAGEGATEVAINLGTLDDPEAVRPDHHIWTRRRIAWFDTADDLPRHAGHGPASPIPKKEAES